MTQESPSVLALNGGSSSTKFVLCQTGDPPKQGLHGKVDLIGLIRTWNHTITFPPRTTIEKPI